MRWQQGWWSADEEAWAVCSERQGKWNILELKLDTALKSQLASMIFNMCWLEIQNEDFQRLLITSRSLGMCHSTFLNPLVFNNLCPWNQSWLFMLGLILQIYSTMNVISPLSVWNDFPFVHTFRSKQIKEPTKCQTQWLWMINAFIVRVWWPDLWF